MNVVLISCLPDYNDVTTYISHFVMNAHAYAVSATFINLNQPEK
jgi:hypothetical protein